jgi:hypothetical protein
MANFPEFRHFALPIPRLITLFYKREPANLLQ